MSAQPISASQTISSVKPPLPASKSSLPAIKSALVSQGRMSNPRRSVTSQFLKSATDRRHTVVNPQSAFRSSTTGRQSIPHSSTAQAQRSGSDSTTGGQPRRASDGRKVKHVAQLKTTTATVARRTSEPRNKSSGRPQLNSAKNKVTAMAAKVPTTLSSGFQSCRDRRKSYQAELVVRQKAAKKPVTLLPSITAAGGNRQPQASAGVNKEPHALGHSSTAAASQLESGFRISTPHSSRRRRTSATVTPALSCIPRRKTTATVSFATPRHKTVSFVTPASQHKTTPHLQRTQPVHKEMSMRYS